MSQQATTPAAASIMATGVPHTLFPLAVTMFVKFPHVLFVTSTL